MLNRDICKQCFLQTMVDNGTYETTFERHWELGEVPCHTDDSFEMLDIKSEPPKDCRFNLEQVMSQC